jgi:mRNA-degrading endonuclease RelE of RelBE toxin-antitoxin system
MQNDELRKIFFQLFSIDITHSKYRDFDFSKTFSKKISKLKGKEVFVLLQKIIEILLTKDFSHYKNLRYDLKKYKRVHVNKSYVIIFYDDKTKKVYFIDYDHHDKIYKK